MYSFKTKVMEGRYVFLALVDEISVDTYFINMCHPLEACFLMSPEHFWHIKVEITAGLT